MRGPIRLLGYDNSIEQQLRQRKVTLRLPARVGCLAEALKRCLALQPQGFPGSQRQGWPSIGPNCRIFHGVFCFS